MKLLNQLILELLHKSIITEGGNTEVTDELGNKHLPDRIPLDVVGRDNFVTMTRNLLHKINDMFVENTGTSLWKDSEINNGSIFNGSTSFIMSDEYDSDEIIKYKKSAGDVDVAFPKERTEELFHLINGLKGKEVVKNIKLIGHNASAPDKVGNTLIAVFEYKFEEVSIKVQIDFEVSDFGEVTQTEWSAFAHSSSFEDAKQGFKGVANKYLWRAIIGVVNEVKDNFIVVTPASKPGKVTVQKKQPSSVRIATFSVDKGIGVGFERMKDENGEFMTIDGKDVYRKMNSKEKQSLYKREIEHVLITAFGEDADIGKIDKEDMKSFVRVLDICRKHVPQDRLQRIADRFLEILFCVHKGDQCQPIEPHDPEADVSIKGSMYMKSVEALGVQKHPKYDAVVQHYVETTFGE